MSVLASGDESERDGEGRFADGLAVQRALEPSLVTKAYARSLLGEYLDRIFLPDGGLS